MSANESYLQKLVLKTASLLKKAPMLTVPQAMRAANFSSTQSTDPALQMRVRRMLPSRKNVDDITPPDDVILTSPMPTVSTLSTPPPMAAASVSVATSTTTTAKPKLDAIRLTATGKAKDDANKKCLQRHVSAAMKKATKIYHEERKKGKGGKSAEAISMMVKKHHDGVGPSARSIRRYVNEFSLIDSSPLKRGSPGTIPAWAFESLCVAVESYISINQVNMNGASNKKKNLSARVNGCAGRDEVKDKNGLLNRIFRHKSIDLAAAKLETQEARRIQWTTAKNLTMWFNNWGHDLVQLGFATKLNDDGDIHIPDDQLGRIVNFDETCLSLDGSGNRGGRPEVVFFNSLLPQLGRGTSKSSLTTTMITGSSALGEALPPHFQFQTSAQSEDTMRVRIDTAIYFPGVWCKFGMPEKTLCGVSIGLNEKGGMDEAEFAKYVKNNIIPLYPDVLDVPGKRVMLKVDSGPGRLNIELLAELRLLGWYMYPGVPNTTAVSQETDRNYGPFKTQFRQNLAAITEKRLEQKMSVSLQPWLVGMIVFGGTDVATGFELKDCAFSVGFSKKACLNAWMKVGAAPLTRQCLSDPKVSKSLGDGDDDFDKYLALTEGGYNGALLKATIIEQETIKLTEPHSKERIEELIKATTHGAKFLATGGAHLMTDDLFIAAQKSESEKKIAGLEKVKKRRLAAMKIQQAAKEIMQQKPNEFQQLHFSSLTVVELDTLLRWYNIYLGKMTKQEKVAKLTEVFKSNQGMGAVEEWTADDEGKLQVLKCSEVDLADTALGRKKALQQQQFRAAGADMPDDEFDHIVELRKRKREENNAD